MAYISHIKFWEIYLDNIVSKRYKLQDLIINQIYLEVQVKYKRMKK